MNHLTYARYELLRTVRNPRFLLFSLAFPLILFVLVVGQNKDAHLGGLPFPTYYTTGMVAWGTMATVMARCVRISSERSIGWNRQLRATPLSPRIYLAAKVIIGYLVAVASMAVLYLAGTALGVRLTATHWLVMTVLAVRIYQRDTRRQT